MAIAQPSSTITAATVASAVMTAFWGGINIFVLPKAGYDLTSDMVAFQGAVTTAVVFLVGYLKNETVYPYTPPDETENGVGP